MHADDPRTRKAALVSLLRRGVITEAEAAQVAGVARQSVAQWLDQPPGAARSRRWRYVLKQVDFAMRSHDEAATVRDRKPRPIPTEIQAVKFKRDPLRRP